MGYLSRKPTSNDPPLTEDNPWGGGELVDDTALLLSGLGKRCTGCKRVTRNQFLKKGLCPDCREKPDDMPDIFRPEYLNLYDLLGYIKDYFDGLANGTCLEKTMVWGRAWITELIQRLEEIRKELPLVSQSQDICKVKLDMDILLALRKAAIAADFTTADEYQKLYQLRRTIGRIIPAFQAFLENPAGTEKKRKD